MLLTKKQRISLIKSIDTLVDIYISKKNKELIDLSFLKYVNVMYIKKVKDELLK